MTILIIVILIALTFEYVNGSNDTGNSIATVVSTKVLTPRQAFMMAAIANLIGALWGTAVAKTIAAGLVDVKMVTPEILVCALAGATAWNITMWWFGMPSSSSHALVGGLCGSVLAASHNNWHSIIWSEPSAEHWFLGKGLLWKVVIPMVASPLCGLLVGFAVMGALYMLLKKARPQWVNSFFGKLQLVSSASMGFMHGTNDAQKTMGIIALSLVAATSTGSLDNAPSWLHFLKTPEPTPGKPLEIAVWIKVLCAITMAFGTAIGGWRIIRTLGHKMVKLQPIHGFAAETTSASIIMVATHFGIPISTTHNISSSIMGVGAAKRLNAIRWTVVEQMVWAWVLTIPMSATVAYLLVRLARVLGFVS
ncbi:MAG: inorganic phosphate transporter [Verrucomicrobia bacterium]|nr:inorganic phosphate transporter [Verrucomicrobiota bacterium]